MERKISPPCADFNFNNPLLADKDHTVCSAYTTGNCPAIQMMIELGNNHHIPLHTIVQKTNLEMLLTCPTEDLPTKQKVKA